MADKLLEVKGVSKIFRVGGMLRGKKLVAVDNVSLSIDDDKPVILSIVGESGCGKSTLCKMILRLHNPDMGDIVLDGKSYADKKSYDPKQFKLDVQPIHPYTKMLVDALPRVGEDVQRVGIAGRPPALKNPPPGCRFAPRCPHATDRCRSEVPKFREIRPGRFAACHLLEEEVKTNG